MLRDLDAAAGFRLSRERRPAAFGGRQATRDPFHQGLGKGLHVAPGDGAEQDQLQELVIRERLRACLPEAGTQAIAMAVEVRGLAQATVGIDNRVEGAFDVMGRLPGSDTLSYRLVGKAARYAVVLYLTP